MSDLFGARHFRLDELPQDQPMARLLRRQIVGERFMLSEVFLQAGCFVPSHSHVNEQLSIVLQGKLRFRIGAAENGENGGRQEEIVLGAREALHFPSQVPHAAEALEDSLVLDVFSPVTAGTGIDQRR